MKSAQRRPGRKLFAAGLTAALALALCLAPHAGRAADPVDGPPVKLDFQDADITDVIKTIANVTGRNFIYDDRVRGKVTIISPTEMSADQAYAVFESVLQVKGFAIVETPGGAYKVIPVRDAKETSIETIPSNRPSPNRDLYVTRLIPLRYIEADSIVNTLKPLVSKDAAMASYAPTNTVILTESAANIRRLLAIIESIDVESYKDELAVIRLDYADAGTLADQVSDVFGAEVSGESAALRRSRAPRRTAATPQAGGVQVTAPGAGGPLAKVRIITDERTNSLIVLAPKLQLEEVRRLVRRLDVPISGGGRIHVYYLQHADAEELAKTLSAMISGAPVAPRTTTRSTTGGLGGGGVGGVGGAVPSAPAVRSAVTELAEGISVTADPATNSLVIQASQEGYNTLVTVIQQLDVERPQVLVEALIMEIDVNDGEDLGFNGIAKIVSGDNQFLIATASDAASSAFLGGLPEIADFANLKNLPALLGGAHIESGDTTINAIIRAAANNANANIISAPHILTSDNEQAEIRVGDNIPIISSRVESAAGQQVGTLATSVNVERQDIGVTLRVTPQIAEGETLRMELFQEITAVNSALQPNVGDVNQVGPALAKRQVENVVVVGDGDTVVIGGLISDDYESTVTKVPWLGDIPFFGWLFKSTHTTLQKRNLLVFLTPHIVRSKDDLEKQTIRKREEFTNHAGTAMQVSETERAEELARMQAAAAAAQPYEPPAGLNPVRSAILEHEARYPLERMKEIETQQAEQRAEREALAAKRPPEYFLQAALFTEESRAVALLTTLVDQGYDGTLVTADSGGRLVYEVRVGPFKSIEEAQEKSRVLEHSEQLSPRLLVEAPEEQNP